MHDVEVDDNTRINSNLNYILKLNSVNRWKSVLYTRVPNTKNTIDALCTGAHSSLINNVHKLYRIIHQYNACVEK